MEVLLSLAFVCLLVYEPITTAKPSGTPLPYSTIQFVQSWGPGYCKDKVGTCIEHPRAEFYIHGLWPANSIGESLENCKGSYQVLKSKSLDSMIGDIKTNLEANWASLNKKSNGLAFWYHELQKHGICALQTIPDPKLYLQKGLDAKKGANLLAILATARIEPDQRPYTKDEIQRAIGNALGSGITIYITCAKSKGAIYLNEIYLCMDVHAVKFISCPAKADHPSCGPIPQQNIQFPLS